MVPAPLPNGRLTELLDQIRAEFEGQQNKSEDYERNSKFASTPSYLPDGFIICTRPCLCYFSTYCSSKAVSISTT